MKQQKQLHHLALLVLSLALMAACKSAAGGSDGSPPPTTTTNADPLTTVSTLAGSTASGSDDGKGSAASFNNPCGIAAAGGYLYVADYQNKEIRRIEIATGKVDTFAGSTAEGFADGKGGAATFRSPYGIATDGTILYVTDSYNNTIRRIEIATGEVSTFAGRTSPGAEEGTGTVARFDRPYGIATDGTNLYVADSNNCKIRKIVIATKEVSALAGSGSSGNADGASGTASFKEPRGIATDGTNLYVADSANNEIRRIEIATGEVSTFAGSTKPGSADGIGSAASFNCPMGIATDGTDLYVADSNNHSIRKIVIATKEVSTLAGSGSSGHADGVGSAASFFGPEGIAYNSAALYVADAYNNEIRVIK